MHFILLAKDYFSPTALIKKETFIMFLYFLSLNVALCSCVGLHYLLKKFLRQHIETFLHYNAPGQILFQLFCSDCEGIVRNLLMLCAFFKNLSATSVY